MDPKNLVRGNPYCYKGKLVGYWGESPLYPKRPHLFEHWDSVQKYHAPYHLSDRMVGECVAAAVGVVTFSVPVRDKSH